MMLPAPRSPACSSCRRRRCRSSGRRPRRAAAATASRRPRCRRRSAARRVRRCWQNRPAYSLPSETMIAPVRVARSTISCGLKRSWQYQSASARTSRPSASVLSTSIVWPDIDCHDVARPLRRARRHVLDQPDDADRVDLGLARRRARASARSPRRRRPCPISCRSMPAAGLIEMPPVSKVTPLPTKASGRAVGGAAAPLHDDERESAHAALGDAEQRAHAELAASPCAPSTST